MTVADFRKWYSKPVFFPLHIDQTLATLDKFSSIQPNSDFKIQNISI